ncbi:unnamed protein product [Durusdinium trenchii]|uniref:TMEM205-like domain-containing protein n=1 Tax=Durusdinium trenchii TaxID=1381693 RepID=A0ABP0HJW2_9DINO
MAAGLSGQKIPKEYGQTAPFFRLAALVVDLICRGASDLQHSDHRISVPPCAVISAWMANGYASAHLCNITALLGAAYAFGSNVWLLRYGPRMYAVCCKESTWLGKEAFSAIQAACFPEYFALQSGSCILALGGAPSSWAKLLMTIATMLALVNQLVLGPRTAQLMVKLYDTSTGSADQPLLDGSSDVKKTFGMVHGISMLLDLLNLFAVFAYLCMVAG